MRRGACLAVAATLAAVVAWSEPTPSDPFGFVAWNPGAALSLFRTGFLTRSILPTALFNHEAGVALAGGWYASSGLVECRAALGNSNATYVVAQVQLGASWFFADHIAWLRKGPYLGGSLRYWDLVQVYSRVQTHNVAPMLHVGWWFELGPLFLDVRLSQVLAVATISSVPNARPGVALTLSPLPGISPVLPIGLVQVGVKIPAARRPRGATAP